MIHQTNILSNELKALQSSTAKQAFNGNAKQEQQEAHERLRSGSLFCGGVSLGIKCMPVHIVIRLHELGLDAFLDIICKQEGSSELCSCTADW